MPTSPASAPRGGQRTVVDHAGSSGPAVVGTVVGDDPVVGGTVPRRSTATHPAAPAATSAPPPVRTVRRRTRRARAVTSPPGSGGSGWTALRRSTRSARSPPSRWSAGGRPSPASASRWAAVSRGRACATAALTVAASPVSPAASFAVHSQTTSAARAARVRGASRARASKRAAGTELSGSSARIRSPGGGAWASEGSESARAGPGERRRPGSSRSSRSSSARRAAAVGVPSSSVAAQPGRRAASAAAVASRAASGSSVATRATASSPGQRAATKPPKSSSTVSATTPSSPANRLRGPRTPDAVTSGSEPLVPEVEERVSPGGRGVEEDAATGVLDTDVQVGGTPSPPSSRRRRGP